GGDAQALARSARGAARRDQARARVRVPHDAADRSRAAEAAAGRHPADRDAEDGIAERRDEAAPDRQVRAIAGLQRGAHHRGRRAGVEGRGRRGKRGMSQDQQTAAARAEFGELAAAAPDGESQLNLELIMDVRLDVTLEVGRTRISVRNLLGLTQGSVVELDKLAGEPLDVLVNGTLVAHGEVVVVNERFGVRLLDVVSREKRVESLKE